jgi:hypothetical protein
MSHLRRLYVNTSNLHKLITTGMMHCAVRTMVKSEAVAFFGSGFCVNTEAAQFADKTNAYKLGHVCQITRSFACP